MPAPETVAVELERLLRAARSEWRAPSVSAAVVHGGELVWASAVGTADAESGERASPEHQYRIGSITKTFTAVAIMQLRDEGELELDDPLDRHLEGAAHRPTIRALLAHLSGLQREPPGEIWETMRFASADELVTQLGKAERVGPPGAYWHYSNLAYALLGEVVARRAGRPYEEVVRVRILEPLGLARTTFLPESPSAKGYFVEPYFDGVQREPDVEIGSTAAAGQLWSTTADLGRWLGFLTDPDETVLAAASVAEMRGFQALADPLHWTRGFGLGLMLYRDGERILVGHDGGMPGHVSSAQISLADDVGAVVLVNSSAGANPTALVHQLVATAAEGLPKPLDPLGFDDRPADELATALGRWWSEGTEFVLRIREGVLHLDEAAPQRELEPTRFAPDGPDRFRAVSGAERGELLRLVRDDEGRVTKLYFATYPFTREPTIFGPTA